MSDEKVERLVKQLFDYLVDDESQGATENSLALADLSIPSRLRLLALKSLIRRSVDELGTSGPALGKTWGRPASADEPASKTWGRPATAQELVSKTWGRPASAEEPASKTWGRPAAAEEFVSKTWGRPASAEEPTNKE